MNNLTVRLLAEGYTKDSHPDYVKWSGFRELEYTHAFITNAVWETPCGWFCKIRGYCGWGSHGGVDYRPENDNYLMPCCQPDKADFCFYAERERFLDRIVVKCPVRLSNRPYDYQRSLERIQDERDVIRRRFYEQFLLEHPGAECCACRTVDEKTLRTVFRYDPESCVNYTPHGCWQETCVVTGRARDTTLGNLYYDVRVTRHLEKGFLQWNERSINKGVKWFDSKRTVSAINEWLRVNPDTIQRREDGKFRTDRIFFNKKIDVVVENIRIEKRPSRDLRQDLADIAEGIEVTHNSDLVKRSASAKRERREARREAKQRKHERDNIQKWLSCVSDETRSDAIREHARQQLEALGIDYGNASASNPEEQMRLWDD